MNKEEKEPFYFGAFMSLLLVMAFILVFLCDSLGMLPENPTPTPCVSTIDTGTVIKTYAERWGSSGSWYDYYLGVDFDNQPDKTFSISQEHYLLLKEGDRVKVTHGCEALNNWYKAIEKIEVSND